MDARALRRLLEAAFVAVLGALALALSIPLLIFGAVVIGLLMLLIEARASHNRTQPSEAAPSPSVQQIAGDVISINQRGGQTAGQIMNIGLQPRTLQGRDVSDAVSRLSKYRGTRILVASLTLDGESNRFADEITNLLRQAGWEVNINRTLLGHEYRGIGIRCPDAELPMALEELMRCLLALGFHVEAAVNVNEAGGNEILVLSN